MSLLGSVYFEETGEERRVVSLCKRCRWVPDGRDVPIVSPTGVAHEHHAFHHEKTACGIDATGLDWWWRL